MKSITKIIVSFFTVFVCSLFSTGSFADEIHLSPNEQVMTEATEMIFDQEKNVITYLSPEEATEMNVNVSDIFSDVPDEIWYKQDLSYIYQADIMKGVSNVEFAPNNYMTRAEFAVVISNIAKVDLSKYAEVSVYNDVDADKWYSPAIAWISEQQLMWGNNYCFCPENYITREEAMTVLYRFAKYIDSPVLEMYRYDLCDADVETLSKAEINELKLLLSDRSYIDDDEIQSWAEESAREMTRSSIFQGNEKNELNPLDYLLRSECTKIISLFMINDTKPTFYFPGGSCIYYINEPQEDLPHQNEDENNGEIEHGPNAMVSYYEENDHDETSLSWGKISHQTLTDRAFELLKQNTGEGGRAYIYKKMKEEVSSGNHNTGMDLVKQYAWYTDKMENDNGFYYSHFYDPDTGTSYKGSTSKNAYVYFCNHFYNAYTNYSRGSKTTGYKELGMSIHYLEDLSNPYHASNKTTKDSKHGEYESWANALAPGVTTNMTYASYRYIYDSRFIDIANNTSRAAKNALGICDLYDQSSKAEKAKDKTWELMGHTERAVCGLLNRFYYNAGLNR